MEYLVDRGVDITKDDNGVNIAIRIAFMGQHSLVN